MKRYLVHIVSVFMIILITVTVIGVNVNIHECGTSGNTSITFINTDSDDCLCHVPENTESCCSIEKEESSCCTSKSESGLNTQECCVEFQDHIAADYSSFVEKKNNNEEITLLEYVIIKSNDKIKEQKLIQQVNKKIQQLKEIPIRIFEQIIKTVQKKSDRSESSLL